jgi:urease accessory protein
VLELSSKVHGPGEAADTLTLDFERRRKSRQRVTLDSGREAAVLLAPGTQVHDGDLLSGPGGVLVRVRAAAEPVSVARTADPLRLARACYHLGNRHVAVQVGTGWLRYPHDHVLDEMLRLLGLAEVARFEPEPGAYEGHGQRHAHEHHAAAEHAHAHDPVLAPATGEPVPADHP